MLQAGAKIFLNVTCNGLPERDYLVEKEARFHPCLFYDPILKISTTIV